MNRLKDYPNKQRLFLYVEGILGTRWYSWLKHCATSRKVAELIADVFIGIFH